MGGYLYATREQYADLRRICGDLTKVLLSDETALKFIDQLWGKVGQLMTKHDGGRFARRYPVPKVWFRGYERHGGVSYSGRIHLCHTPSIYLIIHELAHETHGIIRPLVPPPDYSRLGKTLRNQPKHHGPEYLRNLTFLRDVVLKYKVFGKYLNSTTKKMTSPARKRTPVVQLNDDRRTYTIRLKPKMADEFECRFVESIESYEPGTPDRDNRQWLLDLWKATPYSRGGKTLKVTHYQLMVISEEVGYFYCQDDEPVLCRNIREWDEDERMAVWHFNRYWNKQAEA